MYGLDRVSGGFLLLAARVLRGAPYLADALPHHVAESVARETFIVGHGNDPRKSLIVDF